MVILFPPQIFIGEYYYVAYLFCNYNLLGAGWLGLALPRVVLGVAMDECWTGVRAHTLFQLGHYRDNTFGPYFGKGAMGYHNLVH